MADRAMNGDADQILTTGRANQTQLAKLFKVNRNDVQRLLAAAGITPVGRQKGTTIAVYDIRDASTAFVKPGYEIEDRLRHMNQADLPPLLTKEFWNSQRARTAHERELGNLWHTDDVQAMVAALLQVVAIQMKLMLDNVERQTGLTAEQRIAIKRISDGTVNGTRQAIADRFAEWVAPQDNPAGADDAL